VSAEGTPPAPDPKLLVEKASDAAIAARGVVTICDVAVSVGRRGPLGDTRVHVKLSLVAQYGSRLPEVAAEVRELVASAVESGTGCTVTAVDVTVSDLFVPGEPGAQVGMGVDPATGARIDF